MWHNIFHKFEGANRHLVTSAEDICSAKGRLFLRVVKMEMEMNLVAITDVGVDVGANGAAGADCGY